MDLIEEDFILNGAEIRYDSFIGGIQFWVDGDVSSLRKPSKDPVVEVELDLPYPITDPDRVYWGQASGKAVRRIFGYQRVRLEGTVASAADGGTAPVFVWHPSEEAIAFIKSSPTHRWGRRITSGFVDDLEKVNWDFSDDNEEPILCRIRLRSALIWHGDPRGRRIDLNAEHLGTSEKLTGRELQVSERDPQRAGDLDCFVYLGTKSIRSPDQPDRPPRRATPRVRKKPGRTG